VQTVHLKNKFWKISQNLRYFKVHLHENFHLRWFGQTNPDYCTNFFFVSNSPRYSTFYAFRIFSVYIQICSVYSQHTNRFIPSILSMRTDSFVFSIQTNRFILRTVCMRIDSFCIFGECPEIISNSEFNYSSQLLKGHLIKKQYVQ
jgi:hypothetical protein